MMQYIQCIRGGVSKSCYLPPRTGRGRYVRHYHGMLGSRPRGPTHRPLRRWAHRGDGGRDGEAVESQLVRREDPRGAEDPHRGGNPGGDGENHWDPGHHRRGVLRERQEVKGDPYFEKTMRAERWGGDLVFLVFFNKDVFFLLWWDQRNLQLHVFRSWAPACFWV